MFLTGNRRIFCRGAAECNVREFRSMSAGWTPDEKTAGALLPRPLQKFAGKVAYFTKFSATTSQFTTFQNAAM
jgi:hypothetical protein